MRALRTGGWLVIEDTDYISGVPISDLGANPHEHTQAVRLQAFASAGVEHTLGRQLPARLRALALRDVDNEGRYG